MQKRKRLFGLAIIIAIIILMIASVVISINKTTPQAAEASQFSQVSEPTYPKEYTNALAEEKPIFLFFYANWCSHCVEFFPTYEQLEKTYQDKYNFIKINIDEPENENLVQEFYVTGIPTVYVVDVKNSEKNYINPYVLHNKKSLKKTLDSFIK